MPLENSLRNVFRFLQKRPVAQIEENGFVVLRANTPFFREFASADDVVRRTMANAKLAAIVESGWTYADVPGAESILETAEWAQRENKTRSEFIQSLSGIDGMSDGVEANADFLSDILLAVRFANLHRVSNINHVAIATLFKSIAIFLAGENDDNREERIGKLLRRPIRLPTGLAGYTRSKKTVKKISQASSETISAEKISGAISELLELDNPENFIVVSQGNDGSGDRDVANRGDAGKIPIIEEVQLRRESLESISEETKEILRMVSADLSKMALEKAVARLEGKLAASSHRLRARAPRNEAQPDSSSGESLESGALRSGYVDSAGVADLLVVKQNIKRYEATEIAHVENVMAGETRSRTHRFFSRREETLFSESERTTEEEHELETATRFELNKETEQTLKKDRKLGFELSLSGKYGPTVEFSSNLSMEASQLLEESSKSASKFAQDVVERSLSRVIDRIKESRTLTLIRESEETNVHAFENDDGDSSHIVGIYQFLEKVYEAQVFNYGIRQMFDFMVPEPASFLWFVEADPTQDLSLPSPPTPLESFVSGWQGVSSSNYKTMEAEYGAEEIPPPPPFYRTLTASLTQGDGTASENDQPRSMKHFDVEIPAGYWPSRANARAQAFTDEHPEMLIQIGQSQRVIDFTSAFRYDLGNNKKVGRRSALFVGGMASSALDEDAQLGVDVFAWETANYTIEFEVICSRSTRHYQNWQKAAYRTIREAYEDRLREHRLKVEEVEAEARVDQEEREYGDSPSVHLRMILQELKKHCISMITEQWFDEFDSVTDDEPPIFDLDDAREEGQFVRFFEQAFEWDQMQYVFYPYYWSRKDTWVDRFLRSDVDPVFQEFLEAGFARVVVPVRPGFELAVNHYFESGEIWNGEGEPPMIGSDTFVSIIEEIMDRTGAPQGEIPVGEDWDVRLPTPLVLLKETRDLPEWTRVSDESWEWEPVEEEDEEES